MNRKLYGFLQFFLGAMIGIGGLLFVQQVQMYEFTRYTRSFDTTPLINSIKKVLGPSSSSEGFQKEYQRMEEIYGILQRNYYTESKISGDYMMQNALKSFVEAIEDPYTVYLDIKEQKTLEEALQGSSDFEGIGAYVRKVEEGVLIEEVIKDGPAFDAQLQPLDIIVQVDDEAMKPYSIGEAVEKIKGPAGTEVDLLILRDKDGKQEFIEKTVTRDKVKILSVTSKIFDTPQDQKIGYIEISSVGKTTEQLFKKELGYLTSQNIRGIILDLRGNGGGFLDIAVEILSHFVPRGKVVVKAKYRIYEDELLKSKGYGGADDLPIVVLVDGLTASAGEIIAMALDELRDAVVIGTRTFGKGSIQTMKMFADSSSLKYTIGKRYSPNDINISGTGYLPEIELPFDRTGYIDNNIDNQLENAKKELIDILKQ